MPYPAFLDTLSPPRSGVYKRVFRTRSPEETVGAILWGQSMSMALQVLLTTFEIALRNRIHASLSCQASRGTGTPSISFPWYDHQLGMRKLEGKTYDRVEALLCDQWGVRLKVQPSPDRVIAGLSFGIWTNILDQQLPTPTIQVQTFVEVFPHYPKASRWWRHGGNRKMAIDKVKDVRAWRNRLAHCKPVWPEGWFRRSATQSWTDVIDRIKSRRAEAVEMLGWMCPQTVQVYATSYGGRLFDELATEQAVFAHLRQPHVPAAGPQFPKTAPGDLAAYRERT